MIRCKFLCASVQFNHQDPVFVRLIPVMPKSQYDPEGSEENRKFWDATPSGECFLSVHQDLSPANVFALFQPGHLYYFDLTLNEEGDDPHLWKLWEVSEQETQMDVRFDRSWDKDDMINSGKLHLGILNKDAFSVFQGRAGTKWSLVITEA